MSFVPVRGYGNRRGGWRTGIRRPPIANDQVTVTPAPPFGNVLERISVADLQKTSEEHRELAVIRNAVAVTSFNWVRTAKNDKPTTVIPGIPPRWTPSTGVQQLHEDQGDFYRDRNAAQYPQHPMEPTVIAGIHSDPHLAQNIDIVACSSTLGNLLRFVRNQDKSFRIIVELIDNTLFLIRRENSPTELIQGVRGYGHTFPQAYTTWDPSIKKSTSHQRLLRYNFGGLQLLVRFEADGYLVTPENETTNSSKSSIKSPQTGVETLSESFKTAEVEGEDDTKTQVPANDELNVQYAGKPVSQDRIFDLKTRSLWKKNQDLLSEEIPRLWIAQINHFITAYHEKGKFSPEDIVVQEVKEDVAKWERNQNGVLAQLAALLHVIIAKSKEEKKFELSRNEGGDLEVRRLLGDAGEALSEVVRKQWIRSSEVILKDNKEDDVEGVKEEILVWDDGQTDYTACSDECRYCGTCTY